MTFTILLKLLIVTTACSAVFGCMCFKGHHQDQFCSSNYVIRGQVLEVSVPVPSPMVPGLITGSTVHRVKVLEVFKDKTRSITIGDVIEIKSRGSSLQCGIQLPEKDMLLGGRGDVSGLTIGLCDIVTEWKDVPDCQRKSLVNDLYDCGCEITTCGENEICTSTMNSCKMAFAGEAVENAYCTRFRGRCRWRTCPSAHNIFNQYISSFMNTWRPNGNFFFNS